MILLALDAREATVLRAMIDLAVQAQGIRLARNAVILDDKIVAAMQKESKENANVVTLNVPADGTSGSGGASG